MIKVSNKQVDSVKKARSKSGGKKGPRSISHSGSCGNCGSKHPPKKCKAFGQKCYGCGKLNHFITMCRSRNQSQSQSKSIPHSTNKPSGTKQNQQTDHVMTSMKSITKITLIHMIMNKTLLLLCSMCNSGTRM